MSEIDQYRHTYIGIVECPSPYAIVAGRAHRNIPLYRLDEDARDHPLWRAKPGDLLLGGGSGESEAFYLAIPGVIQPWGTVTRLERRRTLLGHDEARVYARRLPLQYRALAFFSALSFRSYLRLDSGLAGYQQLLSEIERRLR